MPLKPVMGVDEKKLIQEHIKKQLAKKYSLDDIRRSLIDVGFDRKNIDAACSALNPSQAVSAEKKPFFAKLFAQKKEAAQEEKIKKAAEKKPEPAAKKEPVFAGLFSKGAEKQKEEKIKPAEKKEILKKQAEPQISLPKIQFPEFKMPEINFKAMTLHIVLIFFILCIGATIVFAPASCVTKQCFLEKANACERATYQNSIAGVSMNYESTKDCTIIKTIESIPGTEPDEMKERFVGKSMMCAYYKNDFSPMHIETLSGLIINCEGPLKQELIKYVT